MYCKKTLKFPFLFVVVFSLFINASVSAENEDFIYTLESAPIGCWDIYHKDTSYITDCDMDNRAEFVVIFKDGDVYAGKNKVNLREKQKIKIIKLYRKIKECKKMED